jgi:ketosteroid isomerase-like protein
MNSLEIVEAFGAAWSAHDLAATLALVTDDLVFESTEPRPDGTRYEGRDIVHRVWQPIFDDQDAVFEAEEIFATADRVVQRWRYSWLGGHVRGVDVFRTRGGLVAEKLSYVKG